MLSSPPVADHVGLVSMVVRLALVSSALAAGLVACADDRPTEVVAGAAESGQPVLQAVLEPSNALIADPGAGWNEVDRWYTEGAMTHWATGCSGFDRLGDIFNHGTPQTVVWARGDDRLFQRTDDFGWEADGFADVVEQVSSTCPTVEVGAMTVSTTAVNRSTLGPAVDRVTEGDSRGRVVAIAFDAYPQPSLETDIATPEFLPDRPALMVVATRHNVVSQLVYSPGDRSGAERLPDLVAKQVDALLSTPVEATGPFEKPAPPPSVAPGTATDVELYVDPLTCRNDGFVERDGLRWVLAEPVPYEWRDRNPIVGDLAMDGTSARFVAGPVLGREPADVNTAIDGEPKPLEGFTVAMTAAAVETECIGWEPPEPVVPSNTIGQLDCDDRSVDEAVIPDAGQQPEKLARDADPETVDIRAEGPLQWSGLDGGGRVVVALFLGDTDDANWQIFTCTRS